MSKAKSKSWGGKRTGAGRKTKGDAPKKRVLITMDPDVLKMLDEARGETPRGEIIERSLKLCFGPRT